VVRVNQRPGAFLRLERFEQRVTVPEVPVTDDVAFDRERADLATEILAEDVFLERVLVRLCRGARR
jgi:hypothetical protein